LRISRPSEVVVPLPRSRCSAFIFPAGAQVL